MENVTYCPLSEVDESLLKYAVVIARYRGQWVFVRSRERWEETGALEADLSLVSYSRFDEIFAKLL